jgi:RNA polymerase sigma-70 factor (ECF subfamily)
VTRRDEPLTRALESSASDLLAYLSRRTNIDDAPDLLGEWLFGIARGTLQNHARGERRRWALVDRIRGHVREDTTAPAADAGSDVRDTIDRLEPDLAELVRLVHWDRLSLVDAAELLGIPASTARGRYQRAKEQLCAALSVEAPLA